MSVFTKDAYSIAPLTRNAVGDPIPAFTRALDTATRVTSAGSIETVVADQPRFDFNPVSLAIKGLLIEEERTNLALFSEQMTGGGSPSIWVTGNATIAADSPYSADTLQNNSTNGEHRVFQNLGSAARRTISIYARAGTASFIALSPTGLSSEYAEFNLSTGVVVGSAGGAASIEDAGGGFYRCIYTETGSAGQFLIVNMGESAGQAVPGTSYVGTNKTVHLRKSQAEADTTRTSYIPTTTALTRSADAFTIQPIPDTVLDPIEAGQVCVYAEWMPGPKTDYVVFEFNNGVSSRFGVYRNSSNNRIQGYVVNAELGATQWDAGSVDVSAGATGRAAVRFRTDDAALSVDGGAVTTDSSLTLPTVDRLYFGRSVVSSSNNFRLNGHLRKLVFYSELTNAELVTLSGGGSISTKPVLEFDFTTDDLETQTGSLDLARIGYHNLARDLAASDVTASSETDEGPKDAPLSHDTYEYWEPSSVTATWQADLGSAKTVDFVGIAAHNIYTKGCSVQAQYSHDASTWFDASDAETPEDDGAIALLFGAQVARYWRVRLASIASPTEIPRISVIFLCRALTMQRSIYGGHPPITLQRDTVIHQPETRGGQFLLQTIRKQGYETQVSFRHLTPAWVRQKFDPFVESARIHPYFFAWKPGDYPDEIAYCRTSQDIRPSNMGLREFMQVGWSMRGHAD